MKKKIIYLAHPISGDIEGNLADIVRILRVINTNSIYLRSCYFPSEDDQIGILSSNFSNIIPICPYYADILALDDNDPLQRKRGIENDTALILTGVFNECWLTGNKISFGMQEEIKLFRSLGTPILDYTNKI